MKRLFAGRLLANPFNRLISRGACLWGLFLVASTLHAQTIHYVQTNSPAPASPFTNWFTAAHDIQSAIDAAAEGDFVLVTNGIYSSGGKALDTTYYLTNRIVVANGVHVQSANGPAVTTIVGAGPLGSNAVRCAYLFTNASLSGFTLTNGHTRSVWMNPYCNAGGARMEANSVISNCVITGCAALNNGGGIFGLASNVVIHCVVRGNTGNTGAGLYLSRADLVRNCLIANNDGGGLYIAYDGDVENCTISGNDAFSGGGLYFSASGRVRNAIIYRNTGDHNENWYWPSNSVTVEHTCLSPLSPGTNNIDADPRFRLAGEDYRLRVDSPCINQGTNMSWMEGALDIYGNNRITEDVVDMGAHEFILGPLECGFDVEPRRSVSPLNARFTAYVAGTNTGGTGLAWDFENDGTNDAYTSALVISNTYTLPGYWSVRLLMTNIVGETASYFRTNVVLVSPSNIYVSLSGTHDFPFVNWRQAATTAHAAVDAAWDGSVVHVTDGVYAVATALVITNAIEMRSERGAAFTTLRGKESDRCLYLGNTGCLVRGFAVMGGVKSFGGGIYCSNGAVLECSIVSNRATSDGGGLYSLNGLIRNCAFSSNSADERGGGAFLAANTSLSGCTFRANSAENGGGLYLAATQSVYACSFLVNTSSQNGAGIYAVGGTIMACSFISNSAASSGGGLFGLGPVLMVSDCTATMNRAIGSGAGFSISGGGTLRNCIANSNTAVMMGGGIAFDGAGSISNCTLAGNYAASGGGGISAGGGLCFEASTIRGNSTEGDGGGVYFGGGEMRNCFILQNSSTGVFSGGGGLYCSAGLVSNVQITGNISADTGGGVYNSLGVMDSCVIASNRAGDGGGVMNFISPGVVRNCTIRFNVASNWGGGIYGGTNNLSCVVTSNVAGKGGGAYEAILDHCLISGNTATGGLPGGGGIYDAMAKNSTIANNRTYDGSGGGAAWSTLEDCTITGNVIRGDWTCSGGGIFRCQAARCLIVNNTSPGDSGGAGWSTVTNCLIARNRAEGDGGGAAWSELIQCTVVNNASQGDGGGIYRHSVINCIVYDNTAPTNVFDEWYPNAATDYTAVDYCCTWPTPPDGNGNISSPPQFVNASIGNFRLASGSPCIDAGTNLAEVADDLDGFPRPLDGNNSGSAQWDMGAYEYVHATADSDHDGLSDQAELQTWRSDPTDTDTDADTMPDGYEASYCLDPTNAADAAADNDGDSQNNQSEYVAVTNPTNGDSFFQCLEILQPDFPILGKIVRWNSSTGRVYSVYRSEAVVGGIFSNIADNLATGSYTDALHEASPGFYRVGVRLP